MEKELYWGGSLAFTQITECLQKHCDVFPSILCLDMSTEDSLGRPLASPHSQHRSVRDLMCVTKI